MSRLRRWRHKWLWWIVKWILIMGVILLMISWVILVQMWFL